MTFAPNPSPRDRGPVLVVGAGPAGATAARRLALAGVPVQLLDRARFPRHKPCGGALSMRALVRFPDLGPALERIASHKVSRLHLEGPDGRSAVLESADPAVVLVRRYEFDHLLVQRAVEAGADLVEQADIVQARAGADAVTLTSRDGRRFEAPLVIAADGVHSTIARRIGLNRGWPDRALAVDLMEEAPRATLRDLDPSTLWVAYGVEPDDGAATPSRRAPEGYAYVFPKRDHVNVGIGYVLSYFRGSVSTPAYPLQRALVERLRARGLLAGESDRRNFTPSLIPVGGPLRRPARGRVLLAGDAGGFVNAFTAEGIYYAMITGQLAADAIVQAAADAAPGEIAAAYRRTCRREIGLELRDSVVLQRSLFADRRRIAALIDAVPARDDVRQLVLDYATGRREYRDVRRRVLRRLPLVGARLACGWMVDAACRAVGLRGH